MISNSSCLRYKVLERSNFSTQLIEFQGRGVLICQSIAIVIVQIVFILLDIDQPSLNLCQSPRALGWC